MRTRTHCEPHTERSSLTCDTSASIEHDLTHVLVQNAIAELYFADFDFAKYFSKHIKYTKALKHAIPVLVRAEASTYGVSVFNPRVLPVFVLDPSADHVLAENAKSYVNQFSEYFVPNMRIKQQRFGARTPALSTTQLT